MHDLFELTQDRGPLDGLYVDDCRTPRPCYSVNWEIVRTPQAFIRRIEQHGLPEIISFDHDLGTPDQNPQDLLPAPLTQGPVYTFYPDWAKDPTPRELTGLDCAKWLRDYCLDLYQEMPRFTVHSANPVGGDNILHLLNNLRRHQGQPADGYRTVW